MSDPEIATKAPESDAMEDQTTSQPPTTQPTATTSETTTQPSAVSSTDSTAQSGPTMGAHCTSDRPAPINTPSSGEITKLANIDTYISKPADYPSTPAKLALLLTGGTGIHSINNQLQADRYAAAGYLVVMPDQFDGDPAPNSTNRVTSPTTATTFAEAADVEAQTPASSSLLDRIKLGFADTAKSFVLDMWLARQTPEKVLPRLLKVLAAAREEYADAVAHGGGIYAIGYCFGARYVMILASEDPAAHPAIAPPAAAGTATGIASAFPSPLIKVGAVAHGTLVTREDVRGVEVPMCVVAVENDSLFPEEVLEAGRKAWAASAVECRVEVFGGVPHGFAVLGEYEDAGIMESQERAFEMMRGWLDEH
ncbi:uncharacterized protein HMPREF1541_05839 [Cyphellophora europaea CBS 101466]|uniref:Dienelactone hydrolase domain-containing protein n=1 Tax=Cyphellophora europaea (strain CBS 101466) TaxID=1220924 RepID=W2RV18_CYPE1|nr:uncharacterized protein HMPREF1541_05839 [Cyphellophora europaea CBS 101466]ETN39613.1 hypothetical protein HMPREF1541_05839 [Cyphellophora europaea CBS 101466]